MQTLPTLFDRRAVDLHRTRAARTPVLFLRDAIASEVQERLNEVNRRFTSPAIVTTLPKLWTDRVPLATTVPDTETLTLTAAQHDLVLHDMGLHWANDPVGQLVQF